MEKREQYIRKLLLVVLTVLLAALGLFLLRGWRSGHFDTAESMQSYIRGFGALAPLVLTLIQLLQVVIPVIPGFLGSLVGTGMFGIAGGFLCNYVGISLGSLAAFLLARHYGVFFVRQMFPGERYDRCVRWITGKRYFLAVLWLSILLPLAPDDFLCYFSGLTDLPFRKFFWIILLAKPWCILAYCVMFGQLF